MPIILIFILIAAATLAAAFFYVSKIISTLPVGRAEDYLNKQSQSNNKIVACIGDSLTHGNVGQSWVDYLRLEFKDTIFLNEGINSNTSWQVLQRLEPILECKPDVIILMIGTNDALGSFDVNSGLRYKRNNKLPEVPSLDKYKLYLSKIIERLSVSSKVAICTLPPIGENKESKVNQHVNQFNDFIKIVAKQKNIHLLQVSDSLWSDIDSRAYPSEIDYNPKSIPLLRRIFGGIFHHYLFKKSWNDIAESKGQWILFDQIHLNERGANIVFNLVKSFISKS